LIRYSSSDGFRASPCGAGLQAAADATTRASAIPYLQQAFRLAWPPRATIYIEVVFHFDKLQENQMPLIAWLLGVPLSVVLILMLLGVF
jgi:hypothetical protein